MFKRLWAKVSLRLRRARSRRRQAERLLICVEQLGTMRLDKAILRELGLGRKRAIRIVCHLLLRERIHMTTDACGRMILMSNPEFERITRRQADGAPETEPLLPGPVPAMIVSEVESIEEAPPCREVLCLPTSETPLPVAPPLEVAAAGTNALPERIVTREWFPPMAVPAVIGLVETAKLPPERQSLPERRREPWSRTDVGRRKRN